MKVTFNEFLNEYGGPNKAIGFRYSKPTNEYKFSLIFVVEYGVTEDELNSQIEEILRKNEFEEDSFTLTEIDGGEFEIEMKLKLYSGAEIQGVMQTFLTEMSEIHNEFGINQESIKIDGEAPSYTAKKPVGY